MRHQQEMHLVRSRSWEVIDVTGQNGKYSLSVLIGGPHQPRAEGAFSAHTSSRAYCICAHRSLTYSQSFAGWDARTLPRGYSTAPPPQSSICLLPECPRQRARISAQMFYLTVGQVAGIINVVVVIGIAPLSMGY